MAEERSILYEIDIDVGSAASALDLILFRLDKIEKDGVRTIKALDSAFQGLNKTLQRALKADRNAQVEERKDVTKAVQDTTAATGREADAAREAAEVAVAAAARQQRAEADSLDRKKRQA